MSATETLTQAGTNSEVPTDAIVDRRNPDATTQAVKAMLRPFSVLHGFGLVLVLLIALVGLAALGYFGFFLHKDNQANREDIQTLKAYMVTMNQQTILLEVVDKNLRDSKDAKPGSAPIDEKVATAKMMYDMAILEGVPLNILCAIAEVESGWNTHAVSPAGCEGLLQVTPSYARLYLMAKGVDYKPGIWFNPVINTMCGVKMLANNQAEHLEKGRTTKENWIFALHSYFWGPANTNVLLSKKDAKVDVPNMAYSMRVIEAAKKYKEKGL